MVFRGFYHFNPPNPPSPTGILVAHHPLWTSNSFGNVLSRTLCLYAYKYQPNVIVSPSTEPSETA